MRFKSLRESLVHIERSFVPHRGVDQSGIQSGRGLIGLLAQISAHLPDLIAIEIDGGHTLDIAAVGDLISLVVEPIADSPVRDQNLAIAQAGHVTEQSGNLLALPIEAHFTIQASAKRKGYLRLMDRGAQLFPLVQEEQQELCHLGDILAILGGGGLHSDLILCLCHDLVAEIGVLHLGDIAIVAEDALRIGHHGLQLILKAERFFEVHCIHSLSLFVDPMISVSVAVVIELLV